MEKIRSNSAAPQVVGRSSCDIKQTCLVERLLGLRALGVLFRSWTRPQTWRRKKPSEFPGFKKLARRCGQKIN